MAESRVPGGDAIITTEEESVKTAGRFRTALPQVLASTAKNMILLDLGMTVAFPTIAIPKLQNTTDPLALNNEQTSWFGIFVQLGFSFVYLLGSLTHWTTAAGVSAAVPIAAVIAISQVPETPIWLLSRGRFEEAERSLCWLRGWVPPSAVKKEFNDLVLYSENIKKLKDEPYKTAENEGVATATDVSSRDSAFKRKLRELLKPQTLRPLSLVLMFFFFQHSSGFTAMRPYMVQVFEEFGLPINAYWVTVLIGVVGLIGNVVCMVGVAWWGKRPLSLVSMAVASMAALLLGSYAFAVISPGEVATAGTRHVASWAPLTLFVVYALMQSIGVLPVPWMILSEVFPFRSRGLASGIAAAGSYMLAFLASKTFLSVNSALSLHGVFWLYGCLGFVGFFVIYWTFSETEGRSLEDIEEFYKKGMRGKIPKKKQIIGETSKEPSINFSPSTSSVVIEKGNGVDSNDEDRMINNTLFKTQSLRNKASKSFSSNDVSNGAGTSTETLDTAFTASTADLQDRMPSTADVSKKSEEAEETREETKVREEKCKKEKAAEEEISDEIKELERTSSEPTTGEVRSGKNKVTDESNAKNVENYIKEKVDVHNEAEVEERTQM
ncbi:facilitated trehalose transporter Tret1-2 homolog isoform X2 [Cryptotermes secundus]|uniref:facilitated trehalose transporter Tret1-2 homolog isoform X2 n=1 Tax=Cryptotermes secundus TaxID=105785 RepID=UPI000CD7BE32|nr:facilitated trehalose transporter Tret1-2 homolog isoform X2 [Cryptotermes secundus]